MLDHSSGDELRERLLRLPELWFVLARFVAGSSSKAVCEISALFLLRFSSRGDIAGGSGRAGVRKPSQV